MTFDRGKLVRILGMLGSDHAGERSTAGQMASALIKDAQLTWEDMIFDPQQLLGLKAELEEKDKRIAQLEEICHALLPKPKPTSHKDRCRACLGEDDWLTDWERTFLRSFVASRFATMTDRQLEILERIEEKIEEGD